jgi:hypothetical protein
MVKVPIVAVESAVNVTVEERQHGITKTPVGANVAVMPGGRLGALKSIS